MRAGWNHAARGPAPGDVSRLWGAWVKVRVAGLDIAFNNLFVVLLAAMAAFGLLEEAAIVFAAVWLHELGHVVAARRVGVRVWGIELLPFGGVARIDDMLQIRPRAEALVAVAGPLTSALLAAAAYLAGQQVPTPAGDAVLDAFVRVNAGIALFNLLPAFPMDGGRLLRAFWVRRIGLRAATVRAVRTGRWMGLLLVGGAVGLWLIDRSVPVVAVTGAFIFVVAGREQGKSLYVVLRYLAAKERAIDRTGCITGTTLVARAKTPLSRIIGRIAPGQYHLVAVLDDEGRLLGTATEEALIDVLFAQGLEAEVGRLVEHPP